MDAVVGAERVLVAVLGRDKWTSVVIFDSEEDANALASRAAQGPPEGAPVKFVSAEVFEVLAQA
jgi:hypothetical protein